MNSKQLLFVQETDMSYMEQKVEDGRGEMGEVFGESR